MAPPILVDDLLDIIKRRRGESILKPPTQRDLFSAPSYRPWESNTIPVAGDLPTAPLGPDWDPFTVPIGSDASLTGSALAKFLAGEPSRFTRSPVAVSRPPFITQDQVRVDLPGEGSRYEAPYADTPVTGDPLLDSISANRRYSRIPDSSLPEYDIPEPPLSRLGSLLRRGHSALGSAPESLSSAIKESPGIGESMSGLLSGLRRPGIAAGGNVIGALGYASEPLLRHDDNAMAKSAYRLGGLGLGAGILGGLSKIPSIGSALGVLSKYVSPVSGMVAGWRTGEDMNKAANVPEGSWESYVAPALNSIAMGGAGVIPGVGQSELGAEMAARAKADSYEGQGLAVNQPRLLSREEARHQITNALWNANRNRQNATSSIPEDIGKGNYNDTMREALRGIAAAGYSPLEAESLVNQAYREQVGHDFTPREFNVHDLVSRLGSQ